MDKAKNKLRESEAKKQLKPVFLSRAERSKVLGSVSIEGEAGKCQCCYTSCTRCS